MNEILFKTNPRLMLLGGLISGFFFSAIMTLFCFQVSNGEHKIIALCCVVIFAIFSIISLFHLFKIQILKISKNGIIVKKLLLTTKRHLKFEEVKNITQNEKEVTLYTGVSILEPGFSYSNYRTIISLKNSEKIELTSISNSDFHEFEKLFFKLKRGEGKIKKHKNKFSLLIYLFENIGALIFIFLTNILSLGLLISIIKKYF